MKAIVSSVFRLTITVIQIVGLGFYLPGFAMHSVSLVRVTNESSCLNDLTIHVTADPSQIMPGQSSTLNWSVDIPPECGYTVVQLNGQSIKPGGSQTVTPIYNTTYQITVLLSLGGSSTQKTASTHVIVNDSATYFGCPYLLPSESMDIWQQHSPGSATDNKLGIQWLDIPTTPLLLEPGVALDNKVASHENLSSAIDSTRPLLSVCIFTPIQPNPDPDHVLPERSNPVATPPTA